MKLSYRTITKPSEPTLFKDKKSKFFGYAFPLQSEEDVKPIIEKLKKEHPTANHLCYAWQLGVDSVTYRANDDGEPNNSAGQPIYGQIVSNDLTQVLIVVVRVFGGTKLGVGGLINAYKNAAMEAILASEILEKEIENTLVLQFPYAFLSKVMYFIKKHQLTIVSQESKLDCSYTLKVPLKIFDEVKNGLEEIYELKVIYLENQ